MNVNFVTVSPEGGTTVQMSVSTFFTIRIVFKEMSWKIELFSILIIK